MQIKLIVVIAISALISSCVSEITLDYENCAPECFGPKVSLLNYNTFSLECEISNNGLTPIESFGFAYSRDEDFKNFYENQILLSPSNSFEGEITNVFDTGAYFVKSFVANDCGYFISEAVRVNIPFYSEEDLSCQPLDNQLVRNGSHIDVKISDRDWSTRGSGVFTITPVSSVGIKLKMIFLDARPIAGKYRTLGIAGSGSIAATDVYIEVIGDNTRMINDQSCFVHNRPNGDIVVTFCDLEYMIGKERKQMSLKIVLP